MPAAKPERFEVNKPNPAPSVVLGFPTVGFGEVLQQTPLASTVELPPQVMFPPEVAVETVIFVITVVATHMVQKLWLLPYAVPTAFVA